MTTELGWIPEVPRSLRSRHARVAAAAKVELRRHAALSARGTAAIGTTQADSVVTGLVAKGTRQTAAPGEGMRLVYHNGKLTGCHLEVPAQGLVLGRDPDSDVVLEDPGAASSHARIRREAGRTIVEDLGSDSGVWVNETRIRGPYPLAHGALLTIGAQRFVVLAAEGTPPLRTGPVRAVESAGPANGNEVRPESTALRGRWRVRMSAFAGFVVLALAAVLAHVLRRTAEPDVRTTAAGREQAIPLAPATAASSLPDPERPTTAVVSFADGPVSPAQAEHADLHVVTVPPGLDVWLDGELRGRSSGEAGRPYASLPLEISPLPPGQHELEVRYRAWRSAPQTVSLESGRTRIATIKAWLPNTLLTMVDGKTYYGMLKREMASGGVVLALSHEEEIEIPRASIRRRRATLPALITDLTAVEVRVSEEGGVKELVNAPFGPAEEAE